MPLGDLPDEGEAEACAACRGAALVEWLEDLVPVAGFILAQKVREQRGKAASRQGLR